MESCSRDQRSLESGLTSITLELMGIPYTILFVASVGGIIVIHLTLELMLMNLTQIDS